MADCPKCGCRLPAGNISVGSVVMPYYLCLRCTKLVDFHGVQEEHNLAFTIGPDGTARDPARWHRDLDLTGYQTSENPR